METDLFAETIDLNNVSAREAIGNHVFFLKDPNGALDFQKILSIGFQDQFLPSKEKIPNFGFTSNVYWIKFNIKNTTSVKRWFLQIGYPKIDSIKFFYRKNSENWEKIATGDMEIFLKRPVLHRTFLFPLELQQDDLAEIYIRFESEGSHQYPMFLVPQETFIHNDRTETFIFGIYYGIVIILAIYNLVLFFLVKDRSYLYYFLYITGFGIVMMNLNGISYQIFWPEFPGWENRSLPFFIGWTFFWSLQFSRKFLNTKALSLLLNRLFLSLMFCMLLLAVISLFISYRLSINLSAILVICFSILIFVGGFDSLNKRYRPARYFLAAWFIFLLGMFLYSFKAFGFIMYNFFTDYGLQIGSALEMSLLSLGLGDRIQHINQEKQKAQLLAFENEKLYHKSKITSQRLELELLKKNIEPHFLLNSINATIIWMEENPEKAVTLLNSLADELRTILKISSEKFIAAEEEINLCRSHLSVMGLRHDKDFLLDISGNFSN
ncbi:MAG: histidine kinase, partial [Spirochaetia bacterium]|nr:histidine kinase [Spirochaetia bacterium]